MPIVINSRFNPYSYEELVKPLQESTQTHEAMAEQYNTLADNADAILANLNPETDQALIDQYNIYRDSLDKASSDLINNGINPNTRRNVTDLRRSYVREINPIKQGIEAKSAAVKSWEERKAKDMTLLGDDPRNFSVSDFMNGKTPSSYAVSGNDIMNHAKQLASAASSRRTIESDPALAMGRQYFALHVQQGYTEEEAAAMAASDLATAPQMQTYLSNMLSAYGAENLSATELERAKRYAMTGLMEGLTGKSATNYQTNHEYLNPLQRQQLANARLESQLKLKAAAGGGPETTVPKGNVGMRQIEGKRFKEYEKDSDYLGEGSARNADGTATSKVALMQGMRDSQNRNIEVSKYMLSLQDDGKVMRTRDGKYIPNPNSNLSFTEQNTLAEYNNKVAVWKQEEEILKANGIDNRKIDKILDDIQERYQIPASVAVSDWDNYIRQTNNDIFTNNVPTALLGSGATTEQEKRLKALTSELSDKLLGASGRNSDTTTFGTIKKLNPDGTTTDTVNRKGKIDKVLTFDEKTNKIDNIVRYEVSPDSYLKGYVEATTADGTVLAIPFAYFGTYSDVLTGTTINGQAVSGMPKGLFGQYVPVKDSNGNVIGYGSQNNDNLLMNAISNAMGEKMKDIKDEG